MEERSIYRNLSPLDHRYYLSNREAFEALSNYLSEEASVRYCVRVEAALIDAFVDLRFAGDSHLHEAVSRLELEISPEEVYREEERTQHNIRALVNIIKRRVPEELVPYVHLGATSADILDTASALRLRDAVRRVVIPKLLDVEEMLIRLARENARTAQVGRTHGQHAVPITFGFAMAEYVARMGSSIEMVDARSKELRGKLAGAVGAYNAMSLIVDDPMTFERDVLRRLGLEPSEHSTQLVEPEYQLRLLLELNVAFGILANLADDLRNLQRSEIGEVREEFGADQVGSSTMPQKRNPWNSEHVKSLWKAFAPRVMTFYLDQISEHQRDLTNSASSRFVAEYVAGLTAALARMGKVLSKLGVIEKRMRANIDATGDLVLSEAAYILLATAGDPDAHEIIRKTTLRCEQTGGRLLSELKANAGVWHLISSQLEKITGADAEEFFSNPALYRGMAAEKATLLAGRYAQIVARLREETHDH